MLWKLVFNFTYLSIFVHKTATPGSQLYQFLLQLLDKKENEWCIKWASRETGVFEIKDQEKLAEMWGNKRNKTITYESLSRALRHYYKPDKNIMRPVAKKMQYQFTEFTLKEWEKIRNLETLR